MPIPRNHEMQEIFPARSGTGPFHRKLIQVDSCPATMTRCFQYGEKTETRCPFTTDRTGFLDYNSPVPLLSRGKHVYSGKCGHPPWALFQKHLAIMGSTAKVKICRNCNQLQQSWCSRVSMCCLPLFQSVEV